MPISEKAAWACGPLVNFALFGHLGAGYRRTLTRWAEAFYPPTRTVGGDVSETGTGMVARNIALQNPLGSVGGNALGRAVCCVRRQH